MKTIQLLLLVAALLQIGCATRAHVGTRDHGVGVRSSAGSSGVGAGAYVR